VYAVQGNNEPFAKNGDWAGCEDEPLATRAIGPVRRAKQRTKSNWATTFNDCEGAKALTIKLIAPIVIPYHRNEAP
jgi:hypothetical protein